jgi:hypothetical protein
MRWEAVYSTVSHQIAIKLPSIAHQIDEVGGCLQHSFPSNCHQIAIKLPSIAHQIDEVGGCLQHSFPSNCHQLPIKLMRWEAVYSTVSHQLPSIAINCPSN